MPGPTVTVGATAKADTFMLNYGAPGVQNTTATFSVSGVETFNSKPTGIGPGFTTDYGTGQAPSPARTLAPTAFRSTQPTFMAALEEAGNYIVAFGNTPYTLTLTADPIKDPQGINYFGYWLSALDVSNQVVFYKEGVEVGALTPADVIAKLGTSGPYYGNPNPPFQGGDSGEPYAFINFYDMSGTFDQVVFTENPAVGGYMNPTTTRSASSRILAACPTCDLGDAASWLRRPQLRWPSFVAQARRGGRVKLFVIV